MNFKFTYNNFYNERNNEVPILKFTYENYISTCDAFMHTNSNL